jgi:pimeloyl-ACP methyl ester carboxylesterase
MIPAVALVALVLSTAYAAENQSFDSNGVKIHYVVEGQGEPVILVHGFTASIPVQWQLPGIFSKLSKDYQVIALDNRGHGKSDKPHDPEQYGAEMVADVVRLMDHLKIEKAHVVGYSMGGFMTGYMVSKYPDRLLSATLGGAGWAEPGGELANSLTELADSLEAGKGIGPLIKRLTPAGAPEPTEEQISAINQMLLLTNDPKALACCARGMMGLAVPEEKLKTNQVPVLCIIGDKDPLKAGVDLMQERGMTNLKVCVVKGADHMTTFTNKQFVTLLQGFLSAHSPAAATAGSEK